MHGFHLWRGLNAVFHGRLVAGRNNDVNPVPAKKVFFILLREKEKDAYRIRKKMQMKPLFGGNDASERWKKIRPTQNPLHCGASTTFVSSENES